MPARRVTLEKADEKLPPTSRSSSKRSSSSSIGSIPKTPATPAPVESPPYSPLTKDWEREYRILREAYHKQERRLDALQNENDALRRQVELLTLRAEDRVEAEENNPPITAPFSPGTKFVSELVEVIELDAGHHALLSSIIDRQQEERKETRRRCSM